MESRTHRPNRASSRRRGLFVAHFIEITENDNLTIARGEGEYSAANDIHGFFACHIIQGVAAVNQRFGCPLRHVLLLGVERDLGPPSFKMTQKVLARNAEKVSGESPSIRSEI